MSNAADQPIYEHLARARRGDQAALAALIRGHQNLVYSVALRMLGNREMAEDLTQDVFMQLSSSLPSLGSAKHLAFWLRKVTSNRAIDQLRRQSRFPTTCLDEEAEPLFAAPGEDPLLLRHLRRLLSELSPDARAVVILRYQEDLDPAQIARTLSMPINTVKSHLTRSMDWLRRQTPEAESLARRRGSV